MTSNTRINRPNKKTSTSNTLKIKKKKHSRRSVSADPETQQQQQQQHQQEQDQQRDEDIMIDASQHPEYVELMEQLEQSKEKRIHKVHNWKDYERKAIIKWYNAQKSQAWNEFYNARKRLRSDLLDQVQKKITKLKQEVQQLNKQQVVPADYDEDWTPPQRLSTISSFVSGATDNEADRDLFNARQPFNGTPHLVYSDDDESRSTTGEEAYPYLVTSTSSNTLRNDNYHGHDERTSHAANYYR